jgi:regulator of sigma E protease
MSIITFIIILALLVLIHELGHFIFAKRANVKVDEFGIGYPPRAKTLFKRGETTFTLNWIPFGGFVKIFGENPIDVDPNSPEAKRSFTSKPKLTQAGILFAGILFNFLLGWLLLSVSMGFGVPRAVSPQDAVTLENVSLRVLNVSPKSPAEEAGIAPGDVITLVKNDTTTLEALTPEGLRGFTTTSLTPVTIEYTHGNAEKTTTLTPRTGIEGDKPIVGLGVELIGTERLPIHKAIWEGLKMSAQAAWGILAVLGGLIGDLFAGNPDFSLITGPVGIVGAVGDASNFGFSYLLSFTAIISINLAVINLLPFPALDGGRLLFVAIEAITRKPINPKFATWANVIGFGLLILLMLVVTYRDIVKLF